jgi:chromosome partitioning protein
MELSSQPGREYILRDEINKLKGYDFVIIDGPPSLGVLTANVIVASNMLLIPLQVEWLAMTGYAHLIKTLSLIGNHHPEQRILLTMYDARTKTSEEVAHQIRDYFKEKVLKTVIPRNVDLSRAPSHGQTIFQYAPESTGAMAYTQLAEEILNE